MALSGMRVLVTRTKQQSATLAEKLRELGATPIVLPSIEIVPSASPELDDAILSITSYDWLVFTSVHGVRAFVQRMAALKIPFDALSAVRIATIGPATAAELEAGGRVPDYVPEEFLSERIVNGLGDLAGRRVLLPRADIASNRLPHKLRQRGAIVRQVVAYRTRLPPDSNLKMKEAVLGESLDILTFTSPSTVRNLAHILGHDGLRVLSEQCRVACIGPVTAEAVRRLGMRVDVVARKHTIEGLLEAMVGEIGTRSTA